MNSHKHPSYPQLNCVSPMETQYIRYLCIVYSNVLHIGNVGVLNDINAFRLLAAMPKSKT